LDDHLLGVARDGVQGDKVAQDGQVRGGDGPLRRDIAGG